MKQLISEKSMTIFDTSAVAALHVSLSLCQTFHPNRVTALIVIRGTPPTLAG